MCSDPGVGPLLTHCLTQFHVWKPGEELETLWGTVNDHLLRDPTYSPCCHGPSHLKSQERAILGEPFWGKPSGSVQVLCRVESAAKEGTGNVPVRSKVLARGPPIILCGGEGQDGFVWSAVASTQ